MKVSNKKNRLRLSISKRMIITYILLILIPTGTLIYFYYLKSSNIIETEVTNSLLQTLKQSDINISNKLNNVADISDEIFLNRDVQEFVSDSNNADIMAQVNKVKNLKDTFVELSNKRDNYRIRIGVSDKNIASGERINFFPIKDIVNKEWYGDVVDQFGGILWTDCYKEKYIDEGEKNIISCARVLKHSFNYTDNDGILLIDIPENSIYSMLATINIENGAELYIVDKYGKAISHRDKNKLGKTILESKYVKQINSGDSGIEKISEDGREFFIIYQTINNSGWKLVAEVDSKNIVKTNTIFNNISTFVFIIISFLIVVFGFILLFAHIVDNMNKQVKKLIGALENQGVELIEVDINNRPKADLTILERNVHNMIYKVKSLMEESYKSKISEREAQLKALQAQINPHFLYNTLDTINWMAVKMDAKEISFMIDALAKYFRLSLSKGRDIVSIKDELELIKVYLTIQQIRFKGAIQFEFIIDAEAETFNMPKLTLQPIIENAIIHGIQKNKDRSGRITIQVKKIEENIIFIIIDNGIGMDKEIIEKVLNNMPSGKEGSYGLHNVNERIKLYFGNEYGISIYSEESKGTKVELKIKAI